MHKINKDTVVEAHQYCAMKNWHRVVQLVNSGVHYVFNMIDVGEYFDAAVQALCLKK